jgi:hypothetical protein
MVLLRFDDGDREWSGRWPHPIAPGYRKIEEAIAGKYGFMFKMVQLSGWVQSKFRPHGAADAGLRITLVAP